VLVEESEEFVGGDSLAGLAEHPAGCLVNKVLSVIENLY
jgi:hypothetical protein